MPHRSWDSYKTLMEIRRRMRQLFQEGILYSEMVQALNAEAHTWTPPFDVVETGEAVMIFGEVPGINRSEVSVQIKGDELTIRGERHPEVGEGVTYHLAERYYGVFQRVFLLPAGVDSGKVETTLNDGMLTIRVPKRKARMISVQ